MVRLLTDENFNGKILRGLRRRVPDLDVARAQDIPATYGAHDVQVLSWAAGEGRVVLTHDASTLAGYAYERVIAGEPMPGVFEVPVDLPIGRAIEDLELIVQASFVGEWEGQVRYLPL